MIWKVVYNRSWLFRRSDKNQNLIDWKRSWSTHRNAKLAQLQQILLPSSARERKSNHIKRFKNNKKSIHNNYNGDQHSMTDVEGSAAMRFIGNTAYSAHMQARGGSDALSISLNIVRFSASHSKRMLAANVRKKAQVRDKLIMVFV